MEFISNLFFSGLLPITDMAAEDDAPCSGGSPRRASRFVTCDELLGNVSLMNSLRAIPQLRTYAAPGDSWSGALYQVALTEESRRHLSPEWESDRRAAED
jgi:hypothetical protein